MAEEQLGRIEAKLDDLIEGQATLSERVANLKQDIAEHKAEHSRQEQGSLSTRGYRLALATGGGGLLLGVLNAIRSWFGGGN